MQEQWEQEITCDSRNLENDCYAPNFPSNSHCWPQWRGAILHWPGAGPTSRMQPLHALRNGCGTTRPCIHARTVGVGNRMRSVQLGKKCSATCLPSILSLLTPMVRGPQWRGVKLHWPGTGPTSTTQLLPALRSRCGTTRRAAWLCMQDN
jgi:hypothetical protein